MPARSLTLAFAVVLLIALEGGASGLAQDVPFVRADSNASGRIDVADGVFVLNFLFAGGPAPTCLDAADFDDNGALDITDGIGVFGYLFAGNASPRAPWKSCGLDPTPDKLSCERFDACEAEQECPDPYADRIEAEIVALERTFAGTVRITGTVKNGGGPFLSSAGQQAVQLYEIPLGGSARLVAQRKFVNLAPGAIISVQYERFWDASSPAEGEFPPTYRVLLSYDPDIFIDGNPQNDDCNTANNAVDFSGTSINALFH